MIPRDEFREAFVDAWRLHRDYFYDPNMHGVDWNAMRDKYAPLVECVRDREELNDLISEMGARLPPSHGFATHISERNWPRTHYSCIRTPTMETVGQT